MLEIEGKNAIVTGSAGGIGSAIVQALAESGCNVWACARKFDADFEEKMDKISKENGVWIKTVYFDLMDSDAILVGIKGIFKEKVKVDILINNAGKAHMGLFELTSMDLVHQIYQTNTFAPMQITQLVLRKMVKQGEGNIINICSVAAYEVYRGNSVYGGSKAALCSFTQSLAAEMIGKGVRINAIAPGFTDTGMSSVFEGDNPDLPLARSAIGRKISPSEIGSAVVGLLSPKMNMIIGQVVRVNGGEK